MAGWMRANFNEMETCGGAVLGRPWRVQRQPLVAHHIWLSAPQRRGLLSFGLRLPGSCSVVAARMKACTLEEDSSLDGEQMMTHGWQASGQRR